MPNLKYALVVVALFAPLAANAQIACETYTVQSGDTLRLIAEQAYGTRDQSPIIFNANRGVVGGNANNIEIGMMLSIPCGGTVAGKDAEMPAVAAETVVTSVEVEPLVELPVETPEAPAPAAEAPAPAATVETTAQDVSFPSLPAFVSAGVFPPFSDGDGDGLMTDIVRASLSGADYLNAVIVNAVSQPFDPLMASTDPDVILSFPWVDPGCENTEFLSERSVDLCENYKFSDTAYEIVMTFFVADRGGLADATQASQFDGKRFCVPQQYPVGQLAEAGFAAPAVIIERGNSVAECISKLLSGQTDVVNADYLSVEETYSVLNQQSIIVDNAEFTWIRSVHAVANQDNMAGMQTLSDFNAGLSQLRESGEWLALAQPYLN